MEADRLRPPAVEQRAQRTKGINENHFIGLQSLVGNRAVTSLISRQAALQRAPSDEPSGEVYAGSFNGLSGVPAGLKGRMLKIYVIAHKGKVSESDAAKLVDLYGMPSDNITRQANGIVKFYLSPREEALIAKARQGGTGSAHMVGPGHPDSTKGSALATAEKIAIGIADIGTDFIPVVSNLKDATIALTGINPVTGGRVGLLGRILSGIFAIPFLGNLLKYLAKGGRSALRVLARLGHTKLGRWVVERSAKIWKRFGQVWEGRHGLGHEGATITSKGGKGGKGGGKGLGNATEEELRGGEHTSGARPSTKGKHQEGQATKKKQQQAADERTSAAEQTGRQTVKNRSLERIRAAAKNLPDRTRAFFRDTQVAVKVRLEALKKELLKQNSPVDIDHLMRESDLTTDELIDHLTRNGIL